MAYTDPAAVFFETSQRIEKKADRRRINCLRHNHEATFHRVIF